VSTSLASSDEPHDQNQNLNPELDAHGQPSLTAGGGSIGGVRTCQQQKIKPQAVSA
jgi:hypothetical protein